MSLVVRFDHLSWCRFQYILQNEKEMLPENSLKQPSEAPGQSLFSFQLVQFKATACSVYNTNALPWITFLLKKMERFLTIDLLLYFASPIKNNLLTVIVQIGMVNLYCSINRLHENNDKRLHFMFSLVS